MATADCNTSNNPPLPGSPEELMAGIALQNFGSRRDFSACVLSRAKAATTALLDLLHDTQDNGRPADEILIGVLWDIQGNLQMLETAMAAAETP